MSEDTSENNRVSLPIVRAAVLLVAILALAAAWQWAPLREWISVETFTRWEASFRGTPLAPYIVIAVYLLGSLVLFPVTLLTVATVFAFGPVAGYGYALLGCILSATFTFFLGRILGSGLVRRLAGSRFDRVRRKAVQHGLITVIVVRIVPMAPFTVVNMVIGASGIRFGDFIVGTFIGMSPGLLSVTVFEYFLEDAVRSGRGEKFMVLGVVLILLVGVLVWIHKRLAHNHKEGLAPRFISKNDLGLR